MKNAYTKIIMSSFFRGYVPILFAFFILTIIKIIISFYFNSPWIFADETVYAETARNIIHGEFYSKLLYCQTYPPGYSIFLTPAYLIFENPLFSYHFILIINTILTSSIIFPAYYLLKKYCSQKYSIIGSIFVALLPAVNLYNFVVMSENLFIPLFTFSFWFLIESFETNSKKWGILAGFSIFLLFFARTTGIAMIIGFFFALVFYALMQIKSKKFMISLKENLYSIISFCIPALLWTFYKLYLGMAAVSDYNLNVYLSSIFNAASNIQSFAQFLSLSFHELEFLALSSYFIFLILALYWIYEIFWNDAHIDQNQFSISENKKNLTTKSGIIYVLVSSIISIFITTTHMFAAVVLQNDGNYYIFGRYVDPIVPIIILFGTIGFYEIFNKNFFKNKKTILACVLTNLLFVIPFLIDFPIENYKFANMFGIFYVQSIPSLMSFSIFITLFVCLISCVFIISLYYKRLCYLLVIILIVFSALGSIYTLQAQYYYSSIARENNHPIVDYLVNHVDESKLIFMSKEDYYSDYGIMTWYSTQFFIQGYLTQSMNEFKTNDPKPQQIDHTISQKILLNNVLAVATKTGFKLYDNSDRKKTAIILPYTITVGSSGDKTENFYSDMWTKNYSKILIEYPKNFGDMNITIKINVENRPKSNIAHTIFKCNNQELKNVSLTGNHETVSIIVPEKYLEEYFQMCEIDSNTWRPSEYGSKDNRDLGIQMEWLIVGRNQS